MPDFTGDWTYQTPATPGAGDPNVGEVVHADSDLGVLLFNPIDDNSTDRTTDLTQLMTDWTITVSDGAWTVVSPVLEFDGTFYVEVTPATQALTDGLKTFAAVEPPALSTPPTLDDLRRYVGAVSTKDDELLQDMLTAASQWVQDRVYPDDYTSSFTVANAILLQSSRWYKRRQSPEGVAGFASEGFVVRVGRFDPDIIASLARNMDMSDAADTGAGVG